VRARRRTVQVLLQAACLAVVLAHVMPAQTSQGLVEIGAARLRQPNVAGTDALTAGTTLRRDGQRYALAATGGLTLADQGRSTAQGLVTASLLGRPGGRTRWEIGGALTAFDQGSLPITAGAYITAREHFAIGKLGAWAGIGIGGVEEAEGWSPTRTVEMASWFASGGARLTVAALVVDTRSEPYGPPGELVTDPITYTDASLGARWTFRRRVEVDARGGLRFISRGALTANGRGTRPFASVDAAVWVTPRIAVVAGIGRQLSDLARGTPDTRFAAVALRFAMHDRVSPPPRRRPPVLDQLRLGVVSDSSGHSRIVVGAPHAEMVELAATFTSWEPVPLIRRGEAWELDRLLPSGAHRVLVRVDGGRWLVPANLPATADDFGGAVGILTIP
jgi:hypothetical protein